MKRLIICLFIANLCLSCKNEIQDPIDYIHDKQNFAMKLADMYFMDAWVSRTTSVEKDSIRTKLSGEFEDLYGIKLVDFHQELARLKNDPVLLAEIMDSVAVILNNKGVIKK